MKNIVGDLRFAEVDVTSKPYSPGAQIGYRAPPQAQWGRISYENI